MYNLLNSDFSLSANLQVYQPAVDAALSDLSEQQIIKRIWERDFTVWNASPDEISNRLGWLNCIADMQTKLTDIESFVDSVRYDGYTNVLLLGMGGSSLAPELFSKTFPASRYSLQVDVLDSTDPGIILSYSKTLNLSRTLFILSTKSGGTEETLSFFKYFYNLVLDRVGDQYTGSHFAAITDPTSKLVDLANEYSFRHIFINDPNIGGRFSALTFFGMVPAALAGVNIKSLLIHAKQMVERCSPATPVQANPAAILGVLLSELAKHERDKATFVLSPQITHFGDWVEQLLAESTGKQGNGILPVIGEKLSQPETYGMDRLFIDLQMMNDVFDRSAEQEKLTTLEAVGHPILRLQINDLYDLAGQFFLWEFATAIAGWRLQINPFDQPNVELAKIRARNMVNVYKKEKSLPSQLPAIADARLQVFGSIPANSPAEALSWFVSLAYTGDYIAIQAYTQPNTETDIALERLRTVLTNITHLAVTIGYGPRFLHSTGQLHKGDRGNGIFIQITADHPADVPIPDRAGDPSSSISFGILIMAQALGDRGALIEQGRRVLRLHIKQHVPETINALANEIK